MSQDRLVYIFGTARYKYDREQLVKVANDMIEALGADEYQLESTEVNQDEPDFMTIKFTHIETRGNRPSTITYDYIPSWWLT